MAITLVAGPLNPRGDGWKSRETLTQSTSTTFQTVASDVTYTLLGVGTATGDRNKYLLATGVEGIERVFFVTGTGEARLLLEAGTATGMWVLNEDDDFVFTRWINGKWRVIQSSATLATST